MFDNFKNFMDPQQYINNAKSFASTETNMLNKVMTESAKTMTELSKVLMDNTQALAKKNAEILQKNSSNTFALMKNLTAHSSENNMAKNQDFMKNSFEEALHDSKELVELATKSTVDFVNLASSKFSENVKEYFQTANDTHKQAL